MDKLIETIVSAIEDKKGKNIVSLDLSGFDGAICSHFVVCNADSTTQVCAIGHRRRSRAESPRKAGREGLAHRRPAERRVGRHGLCGRRGAHFPDRASELLQARGAVGRRTAGEI